MQAIQKTPTDYNALSSTEKHALFETATPSLSKADMLGMLETEPDAIIGMHVMNIPIIKCLVLFFHASEFKDALLSVDDVIRTITEDSSMIRARLIRVDSSFESSN